jgi:hypothetical protein
MTLQRLSASGYNSVKIHRNGDEYVVYEPSRVRILSTSNGGGGASSSGGAVGPFVLGPVTSGRPSVQASWASQGITSMAATPHPPISLGPMFGSPFLVFRW